MDAYSRISTRRTPQSEQADERQVPNSAGGYTFTLDAEARIRRFLVLGTDGATYYTSAADLTKDNAKLVIDFAKADGARLADIILEISEAGRAPKQNPTLFAYAIAVSFGSDDSRRYALSKFNQIVRTGTHLFIFCRYVQQFRGWGRGLRDAVAGWYQDKSPDSLAYQMVKYRQREGWSHGDVLRRAHPGPDNVSAMHHALFNWALGKDVGNQVPQLIEAFHSAQQGELPQWIVGVQAGLSWEMLPDAALNAPSVWQELIFKGIPMTALIRQLPRLTHLGVTRSHRERIVNQLTNPERLKKARIHPVNVLVALRTYASGHSARGESTWSPDRHIIDALDEAYYRSFEFVEPTNKRILLALDVSGSMTAPAGAPTSE